MRRAGPKRAQNDMRRSWFGVGDFFSDNGHLQAPARAFGFVPIITLRGWGLKRGEEGREQGVFDAEKMGDFGGFGPPY